MQVQGFFEEFGKFMIDTHVSETDTLGQRAYRQLRDQILSGELRQGQRLSLRGVANSLGMSMAPVGEALRELSRDGLVESEPGWGTRVHKLTAASLRNRHILRTALECEAARQCAATASDVQLDGLLQLATELDERIDSESAPDEVQRLDSQFHLSIAETSGVDCLLEALRSNQLVRMLAHGSVLAHKVDKPRRQHLQIAESLLSRDADIAERAMREHCVRSMELQLSSIRTNSIF